VVGSDLDVAAAAGESGGELEGAFGQNVEAQWVGSGVPAAPAGPASDASLGGLQRGWAEGCFEALSYLLDVDAQGPQCTGWVGGRAERWSEVEQFCACGGQI
jgi:hypothetical protein